MTNHQKPEHFYERISDVEEKFSTELKNLITESKSKIKFCEEASSTVENGLGDLQMQRDNAKSLIQETFQSYKAILEKNRVRLIKILKLLLNYWKVSKIQHMYLNKALRQTRNCEKSAGQSSR